MGTNWSSTAEIHPLLVHIGHLYTDNKSCIPQIHPVMAIIDSYIILLITVLIPITISDLYPDIMGVVETLESSLDVYYNIAAGNLWAICKSLGECFQNLWAGLLLLIIA